MRPPRPPSGTDPYAAHAGGYTATRCTDPRIAAHIWAALGDAGRVLNVGAGTGSYEPPDREVVAIEPSPAMAARHPGRVVRAYAASLPFADAEFDAAMAVLSDHHWPDAIAGLREMARVARRVVVFQWDAAFVDRVWLTRDYLPEFRALPAPPPLGERAAAIGARMQPVPIPWDCADGFFHAFWRRPEAYLEEAVRRGSSVWARVGPEAEARVVRELRSDLESGAWRARNAALLALDEADVGYRLLVTG
jgi:SAM-dependent methyltransferase